MTIPPSDAPEWFARWFVSPYYAQLYAHRDATEAAAFLDCLIAHLEPVLARWPAPVRVLDLACGQGRHALHLNRRGFDVTGIDLSADNIAAAQVHANPHLRFEVGDMRELDYDQAFHWVLNLFTSFGYFTSEAEHEAVLRNVYHALTPDGLLVIDYLNPEHTRQTLVTDEHQVRGSVRYHIVRRIEGPRVHKVINVYDGDHYYPFEEWVWLFERADFERMLSAQGFEIFGLWGDYSGTPYVAATAERLIVLARVLK
jgi:SAM-dependent methyltransferase